MPGQDNKLSAEDLAPLAKLVGKKMPNGEYRFRMEHLTTGLDVIITDTTQGGEGWQSAHSHINRMGESYEILEGEIFVAVLRANTVRYIRYTTGEDFGFGDEIPHTLYVTKGTLFVTTKYQKTRGETNWVPSPFLDSMVEHLTDPDSLRRLCQKT